MTRTFDDVIRERTIEYTLKYTSRQNPDTHEHIMSDVSDSRHRLYANAIALAAQLENLPMV
jgi:hypothetical protein